VPDRTTSRERFPANGWAELLVAEPNDPSFVGLVSASSIPRTAGLSWHEWRAVSQDLEPDAERPRRARRRRPRAYFSPVRVAEFLVNRQLIASGDAPGLLDRLADSAVS
jgi:hypothetical protein